ncbi:MULTISPECIES: sensor domain-containing protein [Bacillus]|uniref:sensor domain-containing protein n=1 Tax=Bacillus TaxID=1386 RepID=UPI0011438D57|nr:MULTISPECIES: sensor domain-containing diguanylate cyclase [Bacillus]
MKKESIINCYIHYKTPLQITLLYVIAGVIWIFLSDYLIENFITDPRLGSMILFIKKVLYVLVTAVFLFILVSKISMKEKKKSDQKLNISEIALKSSKKELEDVTRALDESSIIAITDHKGVITFVNKQFCEISKYSEEELLGKDHRIVNSGYHPKKFFKEMWQTIAIGKTWHGKIQNRAKDGSIYWVYTTIVPFLNSEGKPYQYVSIRNDISGEKQVEEALQISKQRYQSLYEYNYNAVFTMEKDGNFLSANPMFEKITGYQIQEAYGKHYGQMVLPQCLDYTNEQFKKAANGVPQSYECRIYHKSGRIIPLNVTNVPIIVNGEIIGVYGIAKDLTDLKKTENQLKESEAKYRLIAENMTDLVSIIGPDRVYQYVSPSYKLVLGFHPRDLVGKDPFHLIHQEDFEGVTKKFGEAVMLKENRVAEFRFKHANGQDVWVEAYGKPVLDEEGNLLHIQVISRNVTERKMYEAKLAEMAYHDPLTGIPNRRLFQERLDQNIKDAERYHRKFALLYMDMDKFKQINDSLGHDIGDELLVQFAKRVQHSLRESDTLARQGGDEFIILLSEIKEEQDAIMIAERILASLQTPWNIEGHEFNTTSSIGVAYYPYHGDSSQDLMRRADKALYEAKEAGRNNIKTYNE